MNATECKAHQGTASLSCKSKGPAPTREYGQALGRESVRDSAKWELMGCGRGQLRRKQRRTEVGQWVVGQGRKEPGLPRA